MKFSSAVLLLTTLMLASQSALAAELDFTYSGEAGPERWSLLSPDNALCSAGKQQSPIDIPEGEFKVNRLRPQPKFADAKNVKVLHDGHTVEVASSDESKPLPVQMKISGKNFQLEQMHFHTPSEHRVNGKFFDAEGHLVFTSTGKGPKSVAVVGAFFKTGPESNDFLKPITDEVPQKKGEERVIKELGFSKLLTMLDNLKEVYNYEGSFTTPPCTEGVQFFISRKVQPIDVTQVLSLRSAMGFSARPVQFRTSFSDIKLTKRRLEKKSNYSLVL